MGPTATKRQTTSRGRRGAVLRWVSRSARRLVPRGAYFAAYRRCTDRRVKQDPHAAVGGNWDVIGPLQFGYLRDHGLAPHHRMLDIGCGTLRGGRHFIRYLEPGCYTGFDTSPQSIAFAKQLVVDEGLADRRPRLVVSKRPTLDFADVAGGRYDVLLAQSVFTHLPARNIAECFAHVGSVLADDGTFWFTFFERETGMTWRGAFYYPLDFFAELAARHRFRVELMTDYPHPRGQKMVRLTPMNAPSSHLTAPGSVDRRRPGVQGTQRASLGGPTAPADRARDSRIEVRDRGAEGGVPRCQTRAAPISSIAPMSAALSQVAARLRAMVSATWRSTRQSFPV
jgi:SAM-dependent methyltransferase